MSYNLLRLYLQVSVVLDGAKRAVEFSARGLLKNGLHYTFKSRDLHTLFDRQWHKLGVAVQSSIVSVYMDCKLIERRLTDEKDEIDPSGYTLITTRVEDGRPVDVRLGLKPQSGNITVLKFIDGATDKMTDSP